MNVAAAIGASLRLLIQDNRERLIPALFAAARDTIFSLTRGTSEPLSRIGSQRVAVSRTYVQVN